METLFYCCGACALVVTLARAGGKGTLQMILLMIPVVITVWFVSQAFETKDSYRPRHEEYPVAWTTGRQK